MSYSNKPVLWMDNEGNYWHENVGHYTIPLYTHPVKELTDEEKQMILDIWAKLQPHLFVKAQEK